MRAATQHSNLLICSLLTLIISTLSFACGEPDPLLGETSSPRDTSLDQRDALGDGKGDVDRGEVILTEYEGDVEPLQALYITDYSNFWHDYESQKDHLMEGVSRHLSVEFDLVGKDPEDALALMSAPDFGVGYDVIIYNICFAQDDDLERVNNIISQTRDLGVPAVLLHCAMHSFQPTSPSYPEQQLELRAAEWDWRELHPEVEFPYWWRFTGVDTLAHDWPREMTAIQSDKAHPITDELPGSIDLSRDELYQNIQVREGVTPLYTAYSPQSRREHLVAWTHTVGLGRVFATTLGHSHHTTERDAYHQLIARGIAYVTGDLDREESSSSINRGTQRAENYQATVVCQPSDVVDAYEVKQVQEIVRRAYTEGRPLKVISVPQSHSNSGFVCPAHGGLLLNVGQMNRVLDLNAESQTVTVQPGIRAFELSKYLHEYGFAIRAMPDYTGVSIAGGIATAAHHSSLQIASGMADMVESMVIVDGRGEVRRFEGAEVASAAAHLGMLGVVVEVTLRVEPQFKLRYGHEKGRDDDLEAQIESMVRAHDYARVMWFAGNGRYVLDYYDRVSQAEPGTSRHNLWVSTGSVFRFVGDLPYRVLNRAPLRVQCDSALLRSQLWSAPLKVEGSRRDAPVGWSHEMLGSSCDSGTCPWDNDAVRSRTMEASFPLSKLSAWMTDVRAIIEQNRACFPILGIYLRFSRGSDRWLGFNYGEDTVTFEIHVPKVASETYQERSADVYDEIMQLTLDRYNARPHWGKNSTPAFIGVGARQYPRWADFIALKRLMDPAGLFENKLWAQINGAERVRAYPGCVLSRDCVCAQSSDCGAGYTCEAGGFYEAARVCRPK